MSEALELYHQDGRSAGIYYCSECKTVHRYEAQASNCCGVTVCKECNVSEVKKYYTCCEDCEIKRREAKEQERLDKAVLVDNSEAVHGVFLDGHGYSDGYFFSFDQLEDYLADLNPNELSEIPEHAFLMTPNYLPSLCAFDIVSSLTEDIAHERFEVSDLHGLIGLQMAMDSFVKDNPHPISYDPDYSKKTSIKDLIKTALMDFHE